MTKSRPSGARVPPAANRPPVAPTVAADSAPVNDTALEVRTVPAGYIVCCGMDAALPVQGTIHDPAPGYPIAAWIVRNEGRIIAWPATSLTGVPHTALTVARALNVGLPDLVALSAAPDEWGQGADPAGIPT